MVQIRPLSHGIRHLRIGHEATKVCHRHDLILVHSKGFLGDEVDNDPRGNSFRLSDAIQGVPECH